MDLRTEFHEREQKSELWRDGNQAMDVEIGVRKPDDEIAEQEAKQSREQEAEQEAKQSREGVSEMVGPERPQFVLFGWSIVQFNFGNGGWGASLADLYARKVFFSSSSPSSPASSP
ncbi:hypothetical protein NL676_018552 [Syzygium grande]|nr:hypothetical protein NL676_018552 [Syzygium grande]